MESCNYDYTHCRLHLCVHRVHTDETDRRARIPRAFFHSMVLALMSHENELLTLFQLTCAIRRLLQRSGTIALLSFDTKRWTFGHLRKCIRLLYAGRYALAHYRRYELAAGQTAA